MYVNGGSVIAIGVIFPVLGTVAVVARFVARHKTRAELRADDWLCLPALAIVIVTGALLIWGSTIKILGYHSPPSSSLAATLVESDPQHAALDKLEYTINILNPLGTGLIRLSFLFFYRRIFRGRSFNIVSWSMITLVSVWIFAFTIAELSFCRGDLGAFFDSQIISSVEHCTGALQIYGAEGITCFIMDVAIFVMPFSWIWRLHMHNSQKWIVSSVFLVGLFTVGASAVRMVAMIDVMNYKWGVEQNILGLKAVSDTIGTVSVSLFWQYIEHGTGMVVCCLPSMKTLAGSRTDFSISRAFRSLSFSTRSGSSDNEKPRLSKLDNLRKSGRFSGNITVTNTVDQFTVPAQTV